MAKVIIWKTDLKELPTSCLHCNMYHCGLGSSKADISKIKKAYTEKRHKDCPLVEVEQ